MNIKLMFEPNGTIIGAYRLDSDVEAELRKCWNLNELDGASFRNLFSLKHNNKIVMYIVECKVPDNTVEFIPDLDIKGLRIKERIVKIQ